MVSATDTARSELLEAVDPATGAILGAVARTREATVADTVLGAAQVQPLWAQLRLADRARYLRRVAQAVIDEFDDLARLLGREGGRPPAEVGVVELLPAIEALRWMASDGPRILGGHAVGVHRGMFAFKRARLEYEPLGVLGVIGSRGGPFAQPLGQIGAALLAGDGVVFKPAPGACLAGERIGRLLARAGLPEGLTRVIHGAGPVGDALVASQVAAVMFSGQAAAARQVRLACAKQGKPVTLEVSGGDTMVVLADANLPHAIDGAAWAAFAAAGQARGSLKRAFVVEEVAERFVAGVAGAAQRLTVGDPLDPGTQVGPLASAARLRRVAQLVAEALQAGAQLHGGGAVALDGLPGAFYRPAVLAHAAPEATLIEPAPGPVLAVIAAAGTEHAVHLAREAPASAGASLWTADRYAARRIARELPAGAVWINEHLVSPGVPQGPWGSGRASAMGRTHGEAGLRACAHEKLVTWDPPGSRAPWWFPYDETLARAVRAFAQLGSIRDADRQRGLREGVALARVGGRALRSRRRD